jgi:hypothetical protein
MNGALDVRRTPLPPITAIHASCQMVRSRRPRIEIRRDLTLEDFISGLVAFL